MGFTEFRTASRVAGRWRIRAVRSSPARTRWWRAGRLVSGPPQGVRDPRRHPACDRPDRHGIRSYRARCPLGYACRRGRGASDTGQRWIPRSISDAAQFRACQCRPTARVCRILVVGHQGETRWQQGPRVPPGRASAPGRRRIGPGWMGRCPNLRQDAMTVRPIDAIRASRPGGPRRHPDVPGAIPPGRS